MFQESPHRTNIDAVPSENHTTYFKEKTVDEKCRSNLFTLASTEKDIFGKKQRPEDICFHK